MRAIVMEKFGGPEVLKLKNMPDPLPQDTEVLIKVAYAGVNPVDWKIREGRLKDFYPHAFPIIPGWEVSGRIEKVGKNVTSLKVGNEVIAYIRKPTIQWGGYCEYVTYDASHVARRPSIFTNTYSAGIPLAGLTAWQMLFTCANLQMGETVLILAASGCVGLFATQFAKLFGGRIVATSSKAKSGLVKLMGADEIFDHYDKEMVAKIAARGEVDLFLDCLGGPLSKACLKLVKKGGKVVSILEHFTKEDLAPKNLSAMYHFVFSSGEHLNQICDLFEKGKLRPLPTLHRPLEEAASAQEDVRNNKVIGKVVLKI